MEFYPDLGTNTHGQEIPKSFPNRSCLWIPGINNRRTYSLECPMSKTYGLNVVVRLKNFKCKDRSELTCHARSTSLSFGSESSRTSLGDRKTVIYLNVSGMALARRLISIKPGFVRYPYRHRNSTDAFWIATIRRERSPSPSQISQEKEGVRRNKQTKDERRYCKWWACKKAKIIRIIAAIPPTVPPAIAPVFLWSEAGLVSELTLPGVVLELALGVVLVLVGFAEVVEVSALSKV